MTRMERRNTPVQHFPVRIIVIIIMIISMITMVISIMVIIMIIMIITYIIIRPGDQKLLLRAADLRPGENL